MSQIDALFSPFSLKSLKLRNRIVMAPMTRYFAMDGTPRPEVLEYYSRRSKGGVGLIISEGTTVEAIGAANSPATPNFYGAALPIWKRIVDDVQAGGAAMAPQLWHVGALRDPMTPDHDAPIVSPSGLMAAGQPIGETLSDSVIADTIQAFGRAASAAKRLGFDAVELHGAHGYLIDQFFWAETNRRDDRYGGSDIAARARFAAEIVQAVRSTVGEEFAISLRISQWKQQDYGARVADSPKLLAAWLEPLVDAGADIFHCSQRRFDAPEFPDSELSFAGWVKKLSGKPVIAVGSIGLGNDMASSLVGGETAFPANVEEVSKRLSKGEFDLVAVGRALIADPEWPRHIQAGEPTKAFSADLLRSLD